MNYGSSAVGSALHLATELMNNFAGIDVVHIPYRGDAPLYAVAIYRWRRRLSERRPNQTMR